jgi:predicted Zn finger-like uncharacterized protein
MRLICPNCDAQYEVDASLIPDSGRDVQCADCGHVWFQVPESAVLPEEPDEADAAALLGRNVAPPPGPAQEPAAEPEPGQPPQAALAEPDLPALPRAPLDESLLAVLREEAEREIRARAEETARAASRGLEMQPELGLENGPSLRIRPRAAAARTPANPEPDMDMAGLAATPDSIGQTETTDPGTVGAAPRPRAARRELLPDIDRINSTLDASRAARNGAAQPGLPEDAGRKRKGFRQGFVSVLAMAAAGWAVYAQSVQISEIVPGAATLIDGYVAVIDGARLGLDRLVRDLLQTLNG